MGAESRIESVEATIVDVPLVREFVFADQRRQHASYVIVELRTQGGIVGLGEASLALDRPHPSSTIESMHREIVHLLGPAIDGLDVQCVAEVASALEHAGGKSPLARCAVESAAKDAWAQHLGLPLCDLLGGACRDSIPISWLLTGDDVDMNIEEASFVSVAAGYQSVTIRLTEADVNGIDSCCRVAEEVRDKARLVVDMGGFLPRVPAIMNAHRLAEAGVSYLEQPCIPSDTTTMRLLTKRLSIPVGADERIDTARDVVDCISRREADSITLQPGRYGGLQAALVIAHTARACGLDCRVGCAFAGEIGTAAAVQVAAAIDHLPFGSDLYGPTFLSDPLVVRPLTYVRGQVWLPSEPGIGVTLDRAKLREFARR